MLSRVGTLTNQSEPPPGAVVAGLGDAADSGGVNAPARGGLPPRAFRRVREYILAHLEENLSNPVLADLIGLSAYHFSRAFKQSAGVPPHRFVIQSRVERVKHLLAETELPLAQIAVITGFTDQSHCARRFREFVGVTPSRFRWLRG
jgi:transcriptional regulator GlxA family with amidase domain